MAISTLLQHWVDTLGEVTLPVLARTAGEMERLRSDEDGATPKRIAQVVLHDPIMTVKVLQYLQKNRKQRSTEITTIAHALMMLGTSPFFLHFHEQTSIEARLAEDPAALSGVQHVMSRHGMRLFTRRIGRSCATTSIPKR